MRVTPKIGATPPRPRPIALAVSFPIVVIASGCMSRGYLAESAACKWGPERYDAADVTWALTHAVADADGVWHAAADVPWRAVERVEGYWDPTAGEGGFTWHGVADAVREAEEAFLEGVVEPTGDLDVTASWVYRDHDGTATTAAHAVTRTGCAQTTDYLFEGVATSRRTATFAKDGRSWAWTSVDGIWEGTYEGHVGRDGITTAIWDYRVGDGNRDLRSGESRSDRMLGELEQTYEYRDLEAHNHDWFEDWLRFDGAATQRWESYVADELRETCDTAWEPSGAWTSTCTYHWLGVTCWSEGDADSCTYSCDDGTEGTC